MRKLEMGRGGPMGRAPGRKHTILSILFGLQLDLHKSDRSVDYFPWHELKYKSIHGQKCQESRNSEKPVGNNKGCNICVSCNAITNYNAVQC